MTEPKEFKARIKNDLIIVSKDALDFIKSTGIEEFKIKIILDINDICKRENISKKIVEKISNTQKIPIEIALGVIRSKGKLAK